MPNKQAAKKYLRKAKKLAAKNWQAKKTIKDLQKKIEKAVSAKDSSKIAGLSREFQKKVDKAIKSGWLKANNGNRKKSRLSARVKKSLAE